MNEAAELRTQPNPKWIRGRLGGQTVVDSRRTQFVWEHPYYPAWYVPSDDVSAELVPTGERVESQTRGSGVRCDLVVDDRVVVGAAYAFPAHEALGGLVRIEWWAMDAWFEEETEVFVHPRSPEVRVDALSSTRHVTVHVDGVEVANSRRPTLLFETGLPTRYYLPTSDVRMDLLAATDTETACPYKGWAHYWNVVIGGTTHDDLAWGYRTPLPESAPIAGLVCFYNEHVDIEVDGEPESRPVSPFSADRFA